MVSVQNGAIKIVPANKRPWLARIRAYTPQAEYDLEREWVRLDARNQVALPSSERRMGGTFSITKAPGRIVSTARMYSRHKRLRGSSLRRAPS